MKAREREFCESERTKRWAGFGKNSGRRLGNGKVKGKRKAIGMSKIWGRLRRRKG